MTVSIAMIVKNEEQTLAGCLDSLRGAVDELVIVDTGSTDATRDLARRYTDRVLTFPWRDDFAAARQFAFDQASSDWVAWLDADDRVRGAQHIRSMTADAPAGVAGFAWRYETARDVWGNLLCSYWRERCVRNNGSFHWQGRVHEVLVAHTPQTLQPYDAVVVEHHQRPQQQRTDPQRNLRILERELAEQPDTPEPRLLFYLGREYAEQGKHAQALATLARYVACANWDDERYLAQTQIAELERACLRFDQAIDADLQALKICPHWPAAYFGLARSSYFLRQWHRVIHWTEVGRAMPQPETSHFINPMETRYNWIIYYTNALWHLGAFEEALTWTRRALLICPDDPHHSRNLRLLERTLAAHTPAA